MKPSLTVLYLFLSLTQADASSCEDLFRDLNSNKLQFLFTPNLWMRSDGKAISLKGGIFRRPPSDFFESFSTDHYINSNGDGVLFRSIGRSFDRSYRPQNRNYPEFLSFHPAGILFYANRYPEPENAYVLIAVQNIFRDPILWGRSDLARGRLEAGCNHDRNTHDKVQIQRGTSNVVAQIPNNIFWEIIQNLPEDVELETLLLALKPQLQAIVEN